MSLLISEPPLQVLPSLAVKIGLNEAIILQQVHYWLLKSNNIRDGYKWVYNSYSVRKRSHYSPRVGFTVDNYELYNTMDGCLPNQ